MKRFTIIVVVALGYHCFADDVRPEKNTAANEASATSAKETSGNETLGPWGSAIDPVGDCEFDSADGKLTITVPGSPRPHDLSPEIISSSAPRVLQPVSGDFVIQVRIDGEFQPGGDSSEPHRSGYTGAGLVVFADDRNFVRIERATLQWSGKEPMAYTNFEIRVDGKLERMGTSGDFQTDKEKPTWLRLERKGDQMIGSMSQDGEHWTAGEPKQLSAEAWSGNNIHAGVAAISTSQQAFTPIYSSFSLQQGAKTDPEKHSEKPEPK